jgi:ATP-binding cassette subfamily B protein
MENIKLSSYLRIIFVKYKFYFCALFLTAIVASIFIIAVDYKIKEIIDNIAASPNANIGKLLLLFVFYKFIGHGMYFIKRLLDLKYKPILLTEIMSDTYSSALKHSLHWFDSHLSGDISNKIADFQSNFLTLISFCFSALNNISLILITLFFLININLLSALVIFTFVIIYTPIIYFLLKKQMNLQQEYVSARQETLGIINDSIANIFSIKIIGNIYTEFKLKLTPALQRWSFWEKTTRKFDAYYVDNADTIMVTIMGAVQIYLLAYLYKTGQITPGSFAFIAMITLKIHRELDELLENLLFNINPGIASMKVSYSFINNNFDTQDKPTALTIASILGDIKFNNVFFTYPGSKKDIFHGINIHIPAGQRIGIVGTSGAGKTTLIKCLLRYFDVQKGQILIDDYDITEIKQESLWANISVIPQDITMFHRTILENLQLAKHDASFEEIIAACKKARIHDDIINMENGYNSIVGERGVKVSGGQRQRIAIARAILKAAPILIMDEATSALDTPTEHLIQESLNDILQTSNATTIVIAHRLSTLLSMDRILVLKQGEIIEDGTHIELLENSTLYKTLWDAQINGFLTNNFN